MLKQVYRYVRLLALCGPAWLASQPASAAGTSPEKPAAVVPQQVLANAAAVWHFGGLQSADGQSPLTVKGNVKLGIELQGAERAASLARGGDGKVAEIAGGWLDAGQGGQGCLDLKGNAMTLLLRLRNPSGKWTGGELFCKHGGHDKLVYNLFVNGDRLGFEFGAEGQPALAGQVSIETSVLDPRQWHDLIARYDGSHLTLFVDGFVAARVKAAGLLRQGNTEPVLIGRRGFQGLLDHAALWQRALSDEEIVALRDCARITFTL